MRIKVRSIIYVLIGFILVSSILFDNEIITINIAGRTTTYFVLSVFLYLGISMLLLKEWLRLRPMTLIFIVSYFGISIGSLISTLILSFRGDLLNDQIVFKKLWNDVLYGPVLLMFLIQHFKMYFHKDKYLIAWLKIAFIVIIIGLFQILAIQGIRPFNEWFLWDNIRGEGTRIASTFYWQGPFVLYLGITLPLIFSKLMTIKEFKKIAIYGLMLLGGIVSLFYTGSRTALLMLPAISVPLILAFPRRIGIATFFISIFVLILGFMSWDSPAITRALDFKGGSNEIRLGIVKSALNLWQDSPVFGIGPLQLYENIGYHPHNSYVDILVENGLITMLPFLIFLFSLVYICIDMLRSKDIYRDKIMKMGIAMGVFNYIVYNLFASAITYKFMIPFLALIILYYESEKERTQGKLV